MKLLVTTFVKEKDLERIRPYFDEIRIRGLPQTSRILKEEELIKEIKDIDFFIVELEHVTEKVLSEAKNLKLIASVRAGAGANIDIDAATKRGIPVVHSPGRSADVVADFTMGVLVSLVRNIAKGHFLIKTRKLTEKDPKRPGLAPGDIVWVTNDPENFPYIKLRGPGLTGKTLGIVGLGAIGKEVAKRALSFKMKVIAYDPYVKKEEAEKIGVRLVDKKTLFSESDIVTVHAKVTPETIHLVGEEEISLMKPTSFFINTARAAIVDTEALYKALKEKRIKGAALDVFDEEPLRPDNPFIDLDNVLLTPHIAGACDDNYERASFIVTSAIEDFLKGKIPEYVMNKEVFEERGKLRRGK